MRDKRTNRERRERGEKARKEERKERNGEKEHREGKDITYSKCPLRTALCRGVTPSASTSFTLAPLIKCKYKNKQNKSHTWTTDTATISVS